MKKNRDYTGLERTPSSMAWLIRVRQVHKGRLDKLLKLQNELPELIAKTEEELAAIDAVIPFHEVKVDPTVIVGRRPKKKSLAPRGQMTKQIIRCLKAANGKPVHTPEIAHFFAREVGLDLHQMRVRELVIRVRTRLKALCALGIVRRHHPQGRAEMGNWSLVMDQAMTNPDGT
ncbi:hypothetical protein [Variovorax sp. W6]|uniref:hypothetical protein n=1 Tax=Variovorax sp. W6 TaxID=3093895 RepID=UPI003D8021CD